MRNKGFTLIEILVVIGLFTVILAFGMTINFSALMGGTFRSEQAKIVSALQRARSHAMANMFQKKHGFCYDEVYFQYKIFQGDKNNPNPEIIDANKNINISGTPLLCSSTPGIVFDQLSGNLSPASGDIDLTVTDGIKTTHIIINNEETINW